MVSLKKNISLFFINSLLFICFMGLFSIANAESCSSKGQVQYKYTASGCSYTTQTRTCCSNGSWSDWDKACPVAECKNGETKECGSGQCGQKTCVNERWSACETKANKLGGTAANHDAYCTTGGHNVWCGAMVWSESLGCCGFSYVNSVVDTNKCGRDSYTSSYFCCAKAEELYPYTNRGRKDWGDSGAVEYIN